MFKIISLICCLFPVISLLAQTERITLTKLNSEYVEYAPSISADGKVMVFQSNRNGDYQLYESFKSDQGEWSDPLLLKGQINDYGDSTDLIGGPSLSYDGNYIYFFASYDGGLGVEDIYFSTREGDSWGKPQNIGAPINSKNYEGFPSISSDGKSLYFMRLNKNSRGNMSCYTLMVSHKNEEGEWQKPYALPSKINQGCEKFPRIMPDNETFVFSSIRENTKEGSFDLFQVRHLGDNKWTDPLWLNYANTGKHDYFATVSSVAEYIYLNTKENGVYNLYSYVIPESVRPKKVINVKGIVSGVASKPLASTLKVFNQNKDELIANLNSNPTDGSFTLVLPEGTYQLEVQSSGYYTYEEQMEVVMPEVYGPIHKDIVLNPYAGKAIVSVSDGNTNKSLESNLMVLNLKDSSNVQVDQNSFDVKFNQTYLVSCDMDGYLSQSTTLEVKTVALDTHRISLKMLPKKPEVIIQPRDAETDETLNINLMVKDLSNKKVMFRGKAKGDTTLTLNFKSKYQIYALTSKHLFLKETLDLSEIKTYEKLEHKIKLQLIKPGAKLTLDEVLFASNSTELDKSSYDELAEVYKFLKYNRKLVVEIAAHTDNVGSINDNLLLSNARAQSVVDFLVSKGMDSTRIVAKGYGETEPVSSNNTATGRSKNRRVEFRVLRVL